MRSLAPSATETATEILGGPQDIFYARANTVPLPLMVRAEGIWMSDEDGHDYIDVSSGPVVSNIGHGNTRVAEAMAEQARTLDFAYSRVSRHKPNIDLTRRIAELAGPGYERVCLASGGSEAMEIAIKFLRQEAITQGQSERVSLITCMPSYHGGTVATLAMTGDDSLEPYLSGFAIPSDKVPSPLTYRLPGNHTPDSYASECAEKLELKIRELGPETVLAFVFEPVGGLATGCSVPLTSYFEEIRRICTEYGIDLVFAECLCGTGRTGKFLAAHHWPESMPDIVVMAKGLGSGYTPLGAVLFPAERVDRLASQTGFNFSHTYNANPISCATGLAVLDEFRRLNLIEAAAKQGKYLQAKLEGLKAESPVVGDIRGLGLLMAVELVADRRNKTQLPAHTLPAELIRAHGLKNGLMIYSRRTANGKYGDWFVVAPPLIITEAECDELIARLAATLKDFQVDLSSQGVIFSS